MKVIVAILAAVLCFFAGMMFTLRTMEVRDGEDGLYVVEVLGNEFLYK